MAEHRKIVGSPHKVSEFAEGISCHVPSIQRGIEVLRRTWKQIITVTRATGGRKKKKKLLTILVEWPKLISSNMSQLQGDCIQWYTDHISKTGASALDLCATLPLLLNRRKQLGKLLDIVCGSQATSEPQLHRRGLLWHRLGWKMSPCSHRTTEQQICRLQQDAVGS